MLMKASAYFCDRTETNHSDCLLLRDCLWTSTENREELQSIVEESVRECGFESGVDISELDRKKDSLEKEINKELYYRSDVYKTVMLNDKEYYRFSVKEKWGEEVLEIFVETSKKNKKDSLTKL